VSYSSIFDEQRFFDHIPPKVQEDTDNLTVFALMGSSRVKLHLKMLAKSIPAVNFINVLRACFSYKILAPKITKLKCSLCNFFGTKMSVKNVCVKH